MIIQLTGVSKSYSGSAVLENIDFTVRDKQIVCILGPSGAGKSTLLKILSGAEQGDQGDVSIQAELQVSYVFQEDRLLPWLTVSENIGFVKKDTSSDEIAAILQDVGLASFKDHYPHQLSGGMRQRCSIARAFNYGGNLLLMDEPFHSLDYHLRFELVQKLIALWEHQQCAIVFVTHDIDEALLLGDEIVILSSHPGRVVKKIHIDTPQRDRSLKHMELLKLRTEILEQLLQAQMHE